MGAAKISEVYNIYIYTKINRRRDGGEEKKTLYINSRGTACAAAGANLVFLDCPRGKKNITPLGSVCRFRVSMSRF